MDLKQILDTKDTTSEYTQEEINKDKVVCALAYIPILFWLPLVLGTQNSRYCAFHSNNGLVLFIAFAIISFVCRILSLFTFIGFAYLGFIFAILFGSVELAFIAFGMIFTYQGKVKELPFLGSIKILY